MVSAVAAALASMIAWRSEPEPASLVFVTTKVAARPSAAHAASAARQKARCSWRMANSRVESKAWQLAATLRWSHTALPSITATGVQGGHHGDGANNREGEEPRQGIRVECTDSRQRMPFDRLGACPGSDPGA